MSTFDISLIINDIPRVYRLDEIYDPDLHTDPETIARKQVPAVDSLVVDSSMQTPIIWVVKAVDDEYRTTLGPFGAHVDAQDRVLSYGNDMLFLYYDVTAPYTRLIVDSKFVLYGQRSVTYSLTRVRAGQPDLIISTRLNAQYQPIGYLIPLLSNETNTTKIFQTCHTGAQLVDGDIIVLRTYDAQEVAQLELRLVAKAAVKADDLGLGSSPITAFTVTANQMDDTGNVYLYHKQSVDELVLTPRLHFADGTTEVVMLDGLTCRVYGLEEVDTDRLGMSYEILVKYFIPDQMPMPVAYYGRSGRHLSAKLSLAVTSIATTMFTKLSTIPQWDGAQWNLLFAGYQFNRQAPSLIPVEYTAGYAYDPAGGATQELRFYYDQTDSYGGLLRTDGSVVYTRAAAISTVPFLLRQSGEQIHPFGDNVAPTSTPRMVFNAGASTLTLKANMFGSKAAFIFNFYTNAEPPQLPAEALPPVPTHFQLRNAATLALMTAAPILIDDRAGDLVIPVSNVGTLATSKVFIVELLRSVGGNYTVLYGVPAHINY